MINLILSYIVLPSIFLFSLTSNQNKDILKKGYTDRIKGILVIYVAIHHFSQLMTNAGKMLPFRYVGFLCVSFFFMSSGYGLRLSFDKHYLKHYWIKRLLRLYVPFVLANMTVGVLFNLIRSYKYTFSQIVITSLTMRTVYGNRILWYIMTQCILYFLFYITYKYIRGGGHVDGFCYLLE